MSNSNGSLESKAATRFIPSTNRKDTPNVSIFQDIGYRDDQQDRYVVARVHAGLLLAVMDGHCGHKTCSLIANYLVLFFSEELEKAIQSSTEKDFDALSECEIKQVLQNTVSCLIALTASEQSGSTLTIVFAEQGYSRPDYVPSMRITTAQMGDSLCAIQSPQNDLLIALPRHSVSEKTEDVDNIQQSFKAKFAKECKASGGYIHSAQNPNSGIAVTRSLGDCSFVLIREPEINCFVLPSKDLLLFLASDGVLMPDKTPDETTQEIIQKMRKGQSADEIGGAFKKLDDNTTLLCMKSR